MGTGIETQSRRYLPDRRRCDVIFAMLKHGTLIDEQPAPARFTISGIPQENRTTGVWS
jgi:hypothetical protein